MRGQLRSALLQLPDWRGLSVVEFLGPWRREKTRTFQPFRHLSGLQVILCQMYLQYLAKPLRCQFNHLWLTDMCIYIYHYKQMLVFVYNIYIYIPRCPLRYGVFLLPPAESTIKEREGATGTSFRVPSFPSSETLGHVWYSRRQEREHAMALRAGFGSVFWWDVLAFCWIFVVCDVCFWRSLDGIFWMSYPN